MTRLLIIACCLAAACPAQDPEAVLEQARQELLRTTGNLARYTCVEALEREHYAAPSPAKGKRIELDAAPACRVVQTPFSALKLEMTDRLRLEVTIAENREIHAWPGASAFDGRRLDEMVDGPISTGGFGTYLLEIFDNPGAHITFIGKITLKGHTCFEYAYRVPPESSHYHVGRMRQVTGHGGTFQIDPQSMELVRLTIETDQTPASTGMCRSTTHLEYHRVEFGDHRLLLPIQSDLEMHEPGSGGSMARTTYSGCHEYKAESTIRFDDSEEPADSAKAAAPSGTIQAGIRFTLRTTAPIDMAVAAGGDPFSGKVVHSSDKKALPEGSIVSGRITAVRRYIALNRCQFVVALDRAAFGGGSMVISARADWSRMQPLHYANGSKIGGRESAPDDLPLEGSFVIAGDTKVIRAGFETPWVSTVP